MKMKKIFAAILFVVVMLAFTGCALNRFNVSDVAQSAAEAGISAALANNPDQRTAVCTNLNALDEALNAQCCWKDYLVTISKSFNQPKYEPYAIFVIRMLKDDAPLLDFVDMSDGDKANIRKVITNVATDIGCK